MNTHSGRKIFLPQIGEAERAPGSPSPALSASSCWFFLCSSCSFFWSSSCCCLALSWAACNWSHCLLSSSSCHCRSSSCLCFLKLRKHKIVRKMAEENGASSRDKPTGSVPGGDFAGYGPWGESCSRRLGFSRETQVKCRGKNTKDLELWVGQKVRMAFSVK